MAVYTTLSQAEVADWLGHFSIGNLVALKGIPAGITNTNYFVTTEQNALQIHYVLTVFEQHQFADLPYFVDLMAHLAAHQLACPAPIADKTGKKLHVLKGKPVLMVSCLRGKDVVTPSVNQCAEVGKALANMHVAGQAFKQASINQRGADWRKSVAQKVWPKLAPDDQNLLQSELEYLEKIDLSQLPTGVIHGDLFRDNVLFDGEKLGGFIDFYYACEDILAYDVAITVNEWCLHHHGPELGTFDAEKIAALLGAYQSVRPFEAAEKTLWQAMLRRAALRFWLSRLHDFYFPQAGELTHTKDPNHFKKILLLHIAAQQGAV